MHGGVIKPQHAVRRLYEMTRELGRETFISTEVGQHQMWAAQHFQFDQPNRWMTSGGLGTMGYGLPAAMGVKGIDRVIVELMRAIYRAASGRGRSQPD